MSMTVAPDPAVLLTQWPLIALALLVLAAAATDVRSHKISNRLVGLGLALATLAQWAQGGSAGLLNAGAGLGIGLGLLLPMYLLGVLGAGDVKLMAMVGAFLGPVDTLSAVLLTLLAGGVLATAVALSKGAFAQLLNNVKAMLCGAFVELTLTRTAAVRVPAESVGKLPYAVAIAAGTLGQLVLQQSGRSLL